VSSHPGFDRSEYGRRADQAALDGVLTLQVCRDCDTVLYPYREVCSRCLSDTLDWRRVSGLGVITSLTRVHASYDPWIRQRAPWPVALVRLDCGPNVIANLATADDDPDDDPGYDAWSPGEEVEVAQAVNDNGEALMVARRRTT
jgi:uncharacterized OB-fold protein